MTNPDRWHSQQQLDAYRRQVELVSEINQIKNTHVRYKPHLDPAYTPDDNVPDDTFAFMAGLLIGASLAFSLCAVLWWFCR